MVQRVIAYVQYRLLYTRNTSALPRVHQNRKLIIYMGFIEAKWDKVKNNNNKQ